MIYNIIICGIKWPDEVVIKQLAIDRALHILIIVSKTRSTHEWGGRSMPHNQ